MELSFVLKALQKRWWLIALFAFAGTLPAFLIADRSADTFDSTAVLLVSPPTDSTGGGFFGDPDRYVQGQLNVLSSLTLAEEVATAVGDDSVTRVRNNTTFTQVGDTDIVEITTSDEDAERAREVAQLFADFYITAQRTRAQSAQQDNIDDLNTQISELEALLAKANTDLAAAAQPYLNDTDRSVPPLSTIAPGLTADAELLRSEIIQTRATRDTLVLGAFQTNTEIIQNANLPLATTADSKNVLIVGGYIVGAMLGVIAALMWAQFSRYLIDDLSTSDITGQQVVGTIERHRSLRTNPLAAIGESRKSSATLRQLAVRAEALGSVSRPLAICVVGTRRGAGATTTALALAGRFAQQGAAVVALDADARDRSLTHHQTEWTSEGLPRLVEHVEQGTPFQAEDVLAPTEVAGVRIINHGEGQSVLRRANTEGVIASAADLGDVLIVDGGPLLGSAAVVEICRHVDAIVLAVPAERQLRTQLEDVMGQLGPSQAKLLTVTTNPGARSSQREPEPT